MLLLLCIVNCFIPEEFFFQKAIAYTCEDHRLRLKEDEKMLERSKRSKKEFEEKKDLLKAKVRQADGIR